jgi:2'-5' RNA ligase
MWYFIGVTPPEDIKKRIVHFQNEFSYKWVVEPHITIKTQSGLTADRAWLQPVERYLRQQHPFQVEVTGLRWFADEVLFLGVQSPGIHIVRDDLLRVVNPSEKLRRKYFEDLPYVPHLTLADVRYGIAKDVLRSMEPRARQELIDLPPFPVTFSRVYQQASLSEPYTTLFDIPFEGLDLGSPSALAGNQFC